MNGYVEVDGQKHMWVGKRSDTKQTYPGMLDHLVAGGLVCSFINICSDLEMFKHFSLRPLLPCM